MVRRSGLFIALTLFPTLLGFANAAQDDPTKKAWNIINRSKTATSTYAVYYWNKISVPGQPERENWSAEFNSENLHRVETSEERVIADCRNMTGTALNANTGKTFSGPKIANVACGINTNDLILRTESLGKISTRFGVVDRVKVTDKSYIRTYDIAANGAILWTKFEENGTDHRVVIITETIALLPSLPLKESVFDAQSLKFSAVPDQYKAKPTLPPYELKESK
ncbi:MAG TPA: hypothetical protein VNH64_07195 [Parvularculaceae bacterium]|nr:hypothetical protein [Parvularculaceae bacterium]